MPAHTHGKLGKTTYGVRKWPGVQGACCVPSHAQRWNLGSVQCEAYAQTISRRLAIECTSRPDCGGTAITSTLLRGVHLYSRRALMARFGRQDLCRIGADRHAFLRSLLPRGRAVLAAFKAFLGVKEFGGCWPGGGGLPTDIFRTLQTCHTTIGGVVTAGKPWLATQRPLSFGAEFVFCWLALCAALTS